MKISHFIFSVTEVQFPLCLSLMAMEGAEQIVFALHPILTEFIRPVTVAERRAGIEQEYAAVLVTKAPGGVTRLYGSAIPRVREVHS
jgi:hypothetical protein